jgi:hypothetical protein
MSGLSLITLNIANPSVDRATKQLQWLASRPEQILVLTETKASDGCRHLADSFRTAGYSVTYPYSVAPAVAPAILAIANGSYPVLYVVAGGCALLAAVTITPVKRVR